MAQKLTTQEVLDRFESDTISKNNYRYYRYDSSITSEIIRDSLLSVEENDDSNLSKSVIKDIKDQLKLIPNLEVIGGLPVEIIRNDIKSDDPAKITASFIFRNSMNRLFDRGIKYLFASENLDDKKMYNITILVPIRNHLN